MRSGQILDLSWRAGHRIRCGWERKRRTMETLRIWGLTVGRMQLPLTSVRKAATGEGLRGQTGVRDWLRTCGA